jgi:phosphatidylglycerophosphate synthase
MRDQGNISDELGSILFHGKTSREVWVVASRLIIREEPPIVKVILLTTISAKYIKVVYRLPDRKGEKMKYINQYSAIWIAALLVVVAGVLLLSRHPKWPQWLAFSLVVLGLAAAWVFLHPLQTSQVGSAAQVQASIGQGSTVLLEFQSPY